MMAATAKGDESMVELFLSFGVDVNETDFRNLTALCVAPTRNMAKLLLDRVRPTSAAPSHDICISAHPAQQQGADVNLGCPLAAAVYRQHDSVMKLLLAHGAEINAWDPEGYAPLHRAASRYLTRDYLT
jgi:ankyrin repeat protein